jgi:hypothetical protein
MATWQVHPVWPTAQGMPARLVQGTPLQHWELSVHSWP